MFECKRNQPRSALLRRPPNFGGEVGRQAGMIGYINAFYLFTFTAFAASSIIFLARMKTAKTVKRLRPGSWNGFRRTVTFGIFLGRSLKFLGA